MPGPINRHARAEWFRCVLVTGLAWTHLWIKDPYKMDLFLASTRRGRHV